MWKKRSSKDHIKTVETSEKEISSEEGLVVRGGDKNIRRRTLSLCNPKVVKGRGRVGGGGGQSQKSHNTFQSSEEIDNGWVGGVEREGAPTDERGFNSSGALGEGSWSQRQQENFERLRSMQFSPRLQTTPDIAVPNSRVTHRKLKEVQRWVHEVTIHTQQQSDDDEEDNMRHVGGGGGCRMAVYPDEMGTRKMLDLRRW